MHRLWALVGLVGLSVGTTSAVDPIGWRTDGNGVYPKAQPPLEWSTEKNVIWKTPMPGASNSLPVLLGKRLFIASEPCKLLCLDRESGKILWEKNSSYDDLDLSEDVRKQLRIELDEVEKLNKQVADVNRESDQLRRKLKDAPNLKDEIDKQLDTLKKKADALKVEKQKYAVALRYTEPGKQSTAGFSTPTPVTNGKEVFAAFGNGLIACFDLDGNRKWLKLIEHSTAPFAHANSPLLVGDRVVIHFTNLVALSTQDGTERWRLKISPTHGTSLVTKIGNTDVIVTPNGYLVRATDGTILAEGLGSSGANSPILHDGVAYFVRGGINAVTIPKELPAASKLAPLWKDKVKGNGYWFPSPVLVDGLLYAVDDRGIFSVVEAKTGKLVYEERIEMSGTFYPSISAAGNRIYISSDNGATVVVQAGREHKILARNQLDPFRSSLVFEGKRMYVRTHKFLYCIGE